MVIEQAIWGCYNADPTPPQVIAMIPVQTEDIEELRSWGMGLESMCEHCFFCSVPTRTWHMATNTPVCEGCAQTHEVEALPPREVAKSY